MELRQLEYFLMVSDLASFTRAAERLYVSQPAVTNAVRSLEEELGIQLLDRSQRKVTLTAEGKIFYRHIQNIMQGISTTLNEINDLKSHNRGHLTIGVTPLAGITSTSRLLAEFRAAYPNISISIAEHNVGQLLELLHSDKLDFAFVFDLTEQERTRLNIRGAHGVLRPQTRTESNELRHARGTDGGALYPHGDELPLSADARQAL